MRLPAALVALGLGLVAGCDTPAEEAGADEVSEPEGSEGKGEAEGSAEGDATDPPANPMERGPYSVGLVTIDLYDESRPNEAAGRGRWLRTDILYPALADGGGEPVVLDLETESAGIDLGERREAILSAKVPTIALDALRDGAPDPAEAPYPIIFFSHGSNGIRWQSVFFTLHLASHGYVVISADHEHNTIWDIITGGFSSDSLMDSLADRPDDVRFLLDTVLDMNDDPEDRFYGLMDPDKIGATGHSAGALTALSLPCLDDRFDVAVLHSPHIHGGFAFGGCQTLPYPVPTLTMGGTLDHTINYCLQYCGYRELLVGPPSYLYELTGGGHFTFADICQLNLVEVAKELDLGSTAEGFLRDGCGDENVSYAKAHKTINYYATAFLDAHLRGNPASLEALVDRDDPPFDVVRFFTGEVPDFPDGGCGDCSIF